MKEIRLSLGQINLAVHAIHIVYDLDGNNHMSQEEKKLKVSCEEYLHHLGILDEDGNENDVIVPKLINEAIESYS